MTSLKRRSSLELWFLSALLLCAPIALGQAKDEYGEAGEGPDVVAQTVARISDVQGSVSYARGDDPENWQTADVNVPMTLGDRIYADSKSRVELQVHGGDLIWLGSRTDLAALNLTDDTKQFALKSGVGTFQVRRLDEDDSWEVDTPNAAVTFERTGIYRVDVDGAGNTRVEVREGAASVAAGGGQVSLGSGEAIAIEGVDSPRYDVLAVSRPDAWDNWVVTRGTRYRHAASLNYVSADVVGVGDLDAYGRWETIPEYGNVWSPSRVEVGWVPYRQGRWVWQDPWGWTWISTEPWGWAPYHYGRWVSYSSRWFWVPVAPSVRVVAYAPALVAFVGGGPGYAPGVAIGGGGYVGWFPLAPRDPLIAWWLPRPVVNVNVTNVTYVNRTYVTVVNQNTFVTAGSVSSNIVTSQTVVREVERAPVIRGGAPVIPTMASTRVSVGTATAARPPAAIVSRQVVARVAPPPAPPSFQQKLAVIQENRGAPVSQAAAIRIAARDQAQPRAVASVRPVTSEPGRVTLAPSARSASSTSSRPQAVAPVAPVRGRESATAQRPVAAGPVTGNKSRQPAPASPPPVERERAEPARVEPSPRAGSSGTEPQRAEPRPAPAEPVRPTPAPQPRPKQQQAPPPSRPPAEQPASRPPQSSERPKPTPRPTPASHPDSTREAPQQQRPPARAAAPPVVHERPTPVERVAPPPQAHPKESAQPPAKEREQPARPHPSPTPK